MTRLARGLGLVAVLTAAGCKSLDIENPNAPDAKRALADPSALEAVAGGTMRSWFNTWGSCEPDASLSAMADSYSASWNNWNMNFYSGLDADGTRNSRPWQNDPSAAGRTTIEEPWSGYYSTLSAATDVLRAIRKEGIALATASDTKRAETIAVLMQGAALSGIALNFDKGYVVDENTDLATLAYSNRKELRDAALAKLDDAIALAGANTFTTPSAWTNGFATYTNTQVAKVANTMAAMLLAYYPRNAAENAQVDWAKVAQYAAAGMSSGGAFDFGFSGDGTTTWNPCFVSWANSMDTFRVDTRIAALLDPVTQKHPWPAGGNPQPNSPDKRLGDGSFGIAAMVSGFGNVPKTANGGTDFAWSSQAIFNPARGQHHQSNIAHIRFDLSGEQATTGIYYGYGPVPVITAAENDLLRAEALIRTAGDLALAASLINKTRVTRGGLAAATAADGVAGLTTKLQYEQELELMGLGPVVFYNRRRIDGLVTGTPREMPVPAKELGVFGQPLYTWGGTGPASSPTPP